MTIPPCEVLVELKLITAIPLLRQFLSCPFWFIVEFDDAKFGMINLAAHAKGLWRVEWGGRKDRNDPADMEPMVRLSFDDFIIHPMSVLEGEKEDKEFFV